MIPVTWLPSPYKNLRRDEYPIRGVVSHRIVGTLPSARAAFGVAPGTSRTASSHFGIGYVNGVLTLDQYVDLSDMAWTNGDVREPTWALYQPGVNPNLTTVTIEHEDGGYTGRGVVTEPVWQLSMNLQKLITSGDVTAIRAAGIRVRELRHVAQLAAVSRDTRGFIDHHQIAGPNKPYCFRRWLDDPGFVEGSPSRRDRLLAYLNAEEDVEYLKGADPIVNRRAIIGDGATVRSVPAFDRTDYDAHKLFSIAGGSNAPILAWVPGTNITLSDGTVYDARTRWAAIQSKTYGVAFVHERDVVRLEPVESAGFSQTDLEAAKTSAHRAGFVDAKTKAVVAVQGIKP
jgi:hypothetical protein